MIFYLSELKTSYFVWMLLQWDPFYRQQCIKVSNLVTLSLTFVLLYIILIFGITFELLKMETSYFICILL